MSAKVMRNILIFLLFFLGVGAIGGGGVLIISPTGEMIGMPLSTLKGSPFNSFLIPGIILFLTIGIAPFLVVFGLLRKPESPAAERLNFFKDMHWAWSFSIYVAFALIIWIQVETIFVQGVGWLQTFYMLFAIPMIIVALLPQVRNFYTKRTKIY